LPSKKAMISCCALESEKKFVEMTIHEGSRITTTTASNAMIRRKTIIRFQLPGGGGAEEIESQEENEVSANKAPPKKEKVPR